MAATSKLSLHAIKLLFAFIFIGFLTETTSNENRAFRFVSNLFTPIRLVEVPGSAPGSTTSISHDVYHRSHQMTYKIYTCLLLFETKISQKRKNCDLFTIFLQILLLNKLVKPLVLHLNELHL